MTDPQELARTLLDGGREQRRALAKLLTMVEAGDRDQAARDRMRAVVACLHPASGDAHVIGITGPPGVGKSTLTSALVAAIRAEGRSVAVLAIDPSSPFSGGALLGDRIRMAPEQASDDGVYVRSMATRGHLGGLSWAAPHAIMVLEAAGFDVVLVETVGVGQAELEIAAVADSTVVVMAPGMGDTVQAAKAGILEIADLFVVNKADRPEAHRTVRELRGGLGLSSSGAVPPILSTVASTGEGVAQLAEALHAHGAAADRADRRLRAARLHLREVVLAEVRQRLLRAEGGSAFDELAAEVAGRRQDPYTAAAELVRDLLG